MNRLKVVHKNRRRGKSLQEFQVFSLVLLIFIFLAPLGCSSGGETANPANGSPPDPSPTGWKKTLVQEVAASGIVSPYLKSSVDNNRNLHMAYFTGLTSPVNRVNYILWDVDDSTVVTSEESVIEVENNNGLSLALDNDNIPSVAYQGGTLKGCEGDNQPSDAMFNIREEGGWQEYTGAIGYVERNPVLKNGLAGADMSMTVDTDGDIHICYQFYYEGCDLMNSNFPDLLYVKKNRLSLNTVNTDMTDSRSETVEGNIYNADSGTADVQNNVGGNCSIVLDSDENPIIFYYAGNVDNVEGLRVARKQPNGEWEKEWIDQNVNVGDLSVAKSNEGKLAVAYYVKPSKDGSNRDNFLKYAIEHDSNWQVETVDNSTLCGRYSSLAFNASGEAAIAYYEMKTYSGYELKNLKFAQFNGSTWDREVVATVGDIGLYNYLWFDDNDKTMISTYSNTDKTIYLYSEK